MDLVRKRRPTVLIHRIVFVVQSRAHRDIWTSPSDKPPWRTIHATAVAPLAEASTSEKVRFTPDASNRRDAVIGEPRAADAARDIRGFAQVGREGNRAVVGNKFHQSAAVVMTSRAQGG